LEIGGQLIAQPPPERHAAAPAQGELGILRRSAGFIVVLDECFETRTEARVDLPLSKVSGVVVLGKIYLEPDAVSWPMLREWVQY